MIFLKKHKPIKNKETGELHFQRFCIFGCRWFNINLHYIYKTDEDKHDHDHPWNFLSIVLEGSYADTVDGLYQKRRKCFSIKRNKAEYHHKLAEIRSSTGRCVTLVFTGPRRREWGYVTKNGWFDNNTYRRMKRNGEL